MHYIKKTFIAASLAALIHMPCFSLTPESSPYFSLDLGRSIISSTSQTAGRVAIGYQFLRYLAVEGDYGEYLTDSHTFEASIKGIYPLENTPYAITGDFGGGYVMQSNNNRMVTTFGAGGYRQLKHGVLFNFGWHHISDLSANFIYVGLTYRL